MSCFYALANYPASTGTRDILSVLAHSLISLAHPAGDYASFAFIGDDGQLLTADYAGAEAARRLCTCIRETGLGARASKSVANIGLVQAGMHDRDFPLPSDQVGAPQTAHFAVAFNGLLTNTLALMEEARAEGPARSGFATHAALFSELFMRSYRSVQRGPASAGCSFEELCGRVTERCVGCYAIAAVSPHFPGQLLCCSRGVPLYIGVGNRRPRFAMAPGQSLYVLQARGHHVEISSGTDSIFTRAVKSTMQLRTGDTAVVSDGAVWVRTANGAEPEWTAKAG
ncbi:hypothetical protein PAPHI01_0120 [Pancytospora philotis]|nr:hypothetical protein PAPHI01_0120 [Pancytospora philotis]